MPKKRKYEKCVDKIPPFPGEMPGGAVFPMMLLNYWANENTTNTLECFKMNLPGAAVGTCDEFEIPPEAGMAMRYYGAPGKFKSYPYIPTNNVLYCFMSLDPDHPEHLGATIEVWMGAGEEAEQYIITKPGVWFTPPNVLHGPYVLREVDRPMLFLVCLTTPMMSMAPVKKWPQGFDADKIEEQPIAEKRKYEKHINEIDVKAVAVPPSHKGKVIPIMFYDHYNNDEADRTIDCRMIRESGISFGTGETTGDPMYDFATWPHRHPVVETYAFLGLDAEHPEDLGGTVEFWIGEGAEAEEYIITEPTTIMLPKNTVHLPMYVKEVHSPFVMLTVTDMPIWGGKWIKELPPGFKHAKSS